MCHGRYICFMNRIRRQYMVALGLFSLPVLFSAWQPEPKFIFASERHYSSATNLVDTGLPEGYNQLFAGSGVCLKCHGPDSLGVASVDMNGNDVNVVSDWRSTIMANSAKDPFWRAKVSHETLLYPQHQQDIETKCTSCHAPLGHFNALHLGNNTYSMADALADPLALDGVSCLACHQQTDAEPLFSGHLHYDTFKVAYGPYQFPLVSPMLTQTGYKPEYSPHISDANICAGCHTLITQTLDYDGNPTENYFVEQATYHEWLNSVYTDSVSCQGCHMPSLDKWPVYLVTGSQTDARNPFFLHELVGGNVSMLKLLQKNVETLGLTANEAQFEETIQKTLHMLQQRTLLADLRLVMRTDTQATFSLKLTNLAGHKFPSGYPSRRAFVEFFVATEDGDTLFHSGAFDTDNFELYGQNPDYEPHYDTIVSEEEVQIYELVMGDVNGDVTTVLLRAKQPLKDNRLPPAGFSQTHPVYDTTQIAGAALADQNFNFENGVEGTGTDHITFLVPTTQANQLLIATARVWYQPMPPKWNQEMFAHSTADIDLFKNLLSDSDRSPVLVAQDTAWAAPIVASVELSQKPSKAVVSPIPSASGTVRLSVFKPCKVTVLALSGKVMGSAVRFGAGVHEMQVPKGVSLLLIQYEDESAEVLKVLSLR